MEAQVTRITGYDLKDGKLVPKSRKARLASLPVNKRIAASHNETKRVKPGSRALAQSIPELERSDR